MSQKNSCIKKRRRESAILRGLTPVLHEVFRDYSELSSFYISKVELSAEGGLCNIFLACFEDNVESIKVGMRIVKALAPPTRSALANLLKSNYTPEVCFRYDFNQEKVRSLNTVLEKISAEMKEKPEEEPE